MKSSGSYTDSSGTCLTLKPRYGHNDTQMSSSLSHSTKPRNSAHTASSGRRRAAANSELTHNNKENYICSALQHTSLQHDQSLFFNLLGGQSQFYTGPLEHDGLMRGAKHTTIVPSPNGI